MSPEHIGAIGLKTGVLLEFTTISIEAFVAHCPNVGVKV
jgi:hypothetical protein